MYGWWKGIREDLKTYVLKDVREEPEDTRRETDLGFRTRTGSDVTEGFTGEIGEE